MDQVFKSFSELATSDIATRLRESSSGDPPGNVPNIRESHAVEVTVQFTLADGNEETTAHIAISYVPE